MPAPNILKFKDQTELDHAAAERFRDVTIQAVAQRGQALVAFSGGSTPRGFFQLLAQPPFRETVPWEQMHIFWADERCVPADDPESNYCQVRDLLLVNVPIPADKVHPVKGELPPDAAAAQYRADLKELADGSALWPVLDWVLLGMGADGHTASLFPGQESRHEQERAAIAVESSYQGRPAERVTLTPAIINEARHVLFMVSGSDKAHTLARVLQGPRNPLQLPAQRISPHDGTLTWMVTESAAVHLDL